MMKNNLVSIIVPVYNSEKRITKCVKSLVSQTYENIEIILINDGSTDNSLGIINKLKESDDRIRVFSHGNHGVGYTRNVGIKKSNGDYITFVDADDWLDLDFVEVLLKEIEDNDVAITGYKQVDLQDNLIFKRELKPIEESKFRQMVIWAKLYKRDFLINNNLYFNELSVGEDITYSRAVYSNTEKIKILSYMGYNCVRHIESVTQNKKFKKQNTTLLIFQKLGEISNIKFILKNQPCVNFFFLKELANGLINKSGILDNVYYLDYIDSNWNWILDFYKTNKLKLFFKYNKSEPVKINIATYFVYICVKLRLKNFLVFLLKKIFNGGKKEQ